MTINEIQDEIISDFEMLEDWNDKYGYIIELGKQLSPLAEEFKTEDRIIKGNKKDHFKPFRFTNFGYWSYRF